MIKKNQAVSVTALHQNPPPAFLPGEGQSMACLIGGSGDRGRMKDRHPLFGGAGNARSVTRALADACPHRMRTDCGPLSAVAVMSCFCHAAGVTFGGSGLGGGV